MRPLLAFLWVTAFFSHEIATGGMTKQCVYVALGNTYIQSVSTVSICPLTMMVQI